MSKIIEYRLSDNILQILEKELYDNIGIGHTGQLLVPVIIKTGIAGMKHLMVQSPPSFIKKEESIDKQYFTISNLENIKFVINEVFDTRKEKGQNVYINNFLVTSYTFVIENEEGKIISEIFCTGL